MSYERADNLQNEPLMSPRGAFHPRNWRHMAPAAGPTDGFFVRVAFVRASIGDRAALRSILLRSQCAVVPENTGLLASMYDTAHC